MYTGYQQVHLTDQVPIDQTLIPLHELKGLTVLFEGSV